MTIIDLIRHGEPVGGRRYRGQIDDPLSEKGWHQMRSAVGEYREWHRVVTSPLVRCSAFAEMLTHEARIPLHTDARLKEVGFGCWEGKTAAELEAEDPEQVTRFKRDPMLRPLGAEPLDQFYERVSAALDDIAQQFHGEHILVVCHAGVIRMALAKTLQIPLRNAYRIQVANAGVTRIRLDGVGDEAMHTLIFHDGRLKHSVQKG